MLRKITKIPTDLNKLHDTVIAVLIQFPESEEFSDIEFPDWFDEVFSATDLKKKLREIHELYWIISIPEIRKGLIKIILQNNRIENITTRQICQPYIDKKVLKNYYDDYSNGLIDMFDELYKSLYSSYLNYHKFNDKFEVSVRKYQKDFNSANRRLCVFCGIESTKVIEGQTRPPLDHWMPESKFPFSAINFDNLVPMGTWCNSKKDQRVVMEDEWSQRFSGYYPYMVNDGFDINLTVGEDPTSLDDINSDNCNLSISPLDARDIEYFNSWMKVFNIQQRFDDYFISDIIDYWQEEYERMIDEPRFNMSHATNLIELDDNLEEFRKSYPVDREGYFLMQSWIDFIQNGASNEFRTSLMNRFLD